ncbi:MULTISPECIES: DNA-methyltransferase [unclassified Aurantimonas]|uniref:DNA-methyltransferase n=1 Tax=unclassified Aurantimonas TaxID=2638230 RepID=UPI002E17EF86|nr:MULTISPECIES: DNA methyltransferase [unclassified Aurantimonas]MEC5289413.1 DNA methyltransferase [Aurantimonas sp. C2-3-R2]MEC5410493.1 DNA methyltransferase [Aurantimonas sp. C2-4-R8]
MVNVIDQVVADSYAIYQGDCIDVMQGLPDKSVHLSVYSPPFGGLYNYSSDERDLSNCMNYDQFFEHYGYVVQEIGRITLPGRCSAVHCMDVPIGGAHFAAYIDFPGDIIRLHKEHGFNFVARHAIWKEPLGVRRRTMQKNLAHMTAVEDSVQCGVASADYLLVFRKTGENPVPVANPVGFLEYAGDDSKMPSDIRHLRGFDGDQKQNRFSHWIWRRYASSIWDDIRLGNVLPYEASRDAEDEKHVHPLQLDVIDRVVQMRSNPGETVLTPFMGVGSEVYSAITKGRKGIGAELKTSYYRQAVRNLAAAVAGSRYQPPAQASIFDAEAAA